ncbi:MAG: hypothetical protein GX769_03865 [Erysipelothrix sp.]|nr:hypothetical protein [Erysipelothrix sp.]
MEKIRYDAIDKLLYTEDKFTKAYREKHSINFDEGKDLSQISLALVAYLEKKLKFKEGNLALGMSTISKPNVLALEMDINGSDRVAVSISEVGAIYGLWFKRDNIYINSSISVGASFAESVVLVGLLLEASLIFIDKKAEILTVYQEIKDKINSDQDLTTLLLKLNTFVRDFSASFVWLNNIGEISYRELYISALPYKSAINIVLHELDNFTLYYRIR